MANLVDSDPAMPVRGFKAGLLLLCAVHATVALLPVASANPITTMDYYLIDVPIALVLLNFPINGLFLMAFYVSSVKRSRARRPGSPRDFIVVMLIVILLFTSAGALIDLLVWSGFYSDAAFESFIAGLAAIFISCHFVCRRYLEMESRDSFGGSSVLVALNGLSWGGIIMTDPEAFLLMCVPVVLALWIGFEVLLVHWSRLFMERGSSQGANGQPLRPFYGVPDGSEWHPEPQRGMDENLRVEAVSGCIALLFLLVVLSSYGMANLVNF